jgi:hypothetical protein
LDVTDNDADADAVPEPLFRTALIVAVPPVFAVAAPDESIEAMPGADEPQVTMDVRSLVDPSEYVPIAENCTTL